MCDHSSQIRHREVPFNRVGPTLLWFPTFDITFTTELYSRHFADHLVSTGKRIINTHAVAEKKSESKKAMSGGETAGRKCSQCVNLANK